MVRKLEALRWADKEENMKALKSISIALNIASIVLSVFTIGYILHRRKIGGDLLHENEDGTYSMDFDNLEAVCDDKCRMLILSNPHNPAGIVWPRERIQ